MKGANLAMEQVDAEQHGWIQAPYATKADTDASYKRLLDSCLRPEWAGAIRLGVASHNLFDVAWALTLRDELPASRRDDIDIEMLEGMVPAQTRAVQRASGSMLLYCPIVRERRDRGEPRLPRPPLRREHRAGELPAGDVRDATRTRRSSPPGRALPRGRRRPASTCRPQRLRRPIDVPAPSGADGACSSTTRTPTSPTPTDEPTSPRRSPSTPSTAVPTGSTR